MAFRTFIYLDREKVNDYLNALGLGAGQSSSKKMLKGKVTLGPGEIEAGIETNGGASKDTADSVAYDAFESALVAHAEDDYFDLLSGGCDLDTLPPMSIFRCSGYVEIPESFDTFAMVSEFVQPLKKCGLMSFEGDPATTEFALSFFEQTKADIPILISGNEITISSKLKTSCIMGSDYRIIEDVEDEEVFVLCKVHSYLRSSSVVIFDPKKDFLKLNRAIRRSMEETSDLEPIRMDGPILKAEVIAIYH